MPERDVAVVVSNSIAYRNTCPGTNRGEREFRDGAESGVRFAGLSFVFPDWKVISGVTTRTDFAAAIENAVAKQSATAEEHPIDI